MGRTLALVGSLAIICLLAFLTISVAVERGIDILVVLSGIILAAGWLGPDLHRSLRDRCFRAAGGVHDFRD